MKKKYSFGILAFAMVALLGFSVVSAQGFGLGMFNGDLAEDEIADMEAQRDAMQNAVEAGDYSEWATLMKARLAEMEGSINEESFAAIQERHEVRAELRDAIEEARESGDWSEVEALKEELGVEGKGFGRSNSMGNCLGGRGAMHR